MRWCEWSEDEERTQLDESRVEWRSRPRLLYIFYAWHATVLLYLDRRMCIIYIYSGSTVYSYNNVMYIYEGDHSTFSRTLEYSGFRTCVKVIVGRPCFDSAVLCSRFSKLGVECSRFSDQGGVLWFRMGKVSALAYLPVRHIYYVPVLIYFLNYSHTSSGKKSY